MLTRVREWWARRKLRQAAKRWSKRIETKEGVRAANAGSWTQQPVWHGWEDRWMQGHNDHPAEKLVAKNIVDLAKELVEKKEQVLNRIKKEGIKNAN
jgi:hypothetical protein